MKISTIDGCNPKMKIWTIYYIGGTFVIVDVCFFFFNPHSRMCFYCLFFKREGKGKRKISVREKHGLFASGMHPDCRWNSKPSPYPDWG